MQGSEISRGLREKRELDPAKIQTPWLKSNHCLKQLTTRLILVSSLDTFTHSGCFVG